MSWLKNLNNKNTGWINDEILGLSGHKCYVGNDDININGEHFKLHRWMTQRDLLHKTRHVKITHLATGRTFQGDSHDNYGTAERNARQNAQGFLNDLRARRDLERRMKEEAARQAQQLRDQEAAAARLRAEQERRHREETERQRNARRQELNAWIQLLTSNLNNKHSELGRKQMQLDRITQQVADEEKEIARFNFNNNNNGADTRLIVILGHTGDGKSTFCNRLAGDTTEFAHQGPFRVSGTSQSCTQNLSLGQATINNTRVVFVDTPGFCDTNGPARDRQHGNRVCKYLKGCGGINAFVLVRNSTNHRFNAHVRDMYASYAYMFGMEFFSRLIIVATFVDHNNRQFEMNRRATTMKSDIESHFQIDAEAVTIPVIPFGVNNYVDSLKQLVGAIPLEKFECELIKSPLQDLRLERNRVRSKYGELEREVELKQTELSIVQESLRQIQNENH